MVIYTMDGKKNPLDHGCRCGRWVCGVMVEHAIYKRIRHIQQQEEYDGMGQRRHHFAATNRG